MGISLLGSSSYGRFASGNPDPRDPIPTDFRINQLIDNGSGLVLADLTYPNCTNYEGRKLLLFSGATADWVKRQIDIDPHFIKGSKLVARFAPSPEGQRLAMRFLDTPTVKKLDFL